MGRASREKEDQVEAASFFIARAQEAVTAADTAKSEDACAAFYKEAETWLYMAAKCLAPEDAAKPLTLAPPAPKVGRERRSFQREE